MKKNNFSSNKVFNDTEKSRNLLHILFKFFISSCFSLNHIYQNLMRNIPSRDVYHDSLSVNSQLRNKQIVKHRNSNENRAHFSEALQRSPFREIRRHDSPSSYTASKISCAELYVSGLLDDSAISQNLCLRSFAINKIHTEWKKVSHDLLSVYTRD